MTEKKAVGRPGKPEGSILGGMTGLTKLKAIAELLKIKTKSMNKDELIEAISTKVGVVKSSIIVFTESVKEKKSFKTCKNWYNLF